MKKHFTFLVVIAIFLAPEGISYSENICSTKNLTELEDVLRKSAEYCDRLVNSSFSYSCEEKISEEIFHHRPGQGRIVKSPGDKQSKKNERSAYVYGYQFRLINREIKESRILIEENGQRRDEEDAQVKAKLFGKRLIIFEPVGLLSLEWQPYYDYAITKKAKYRGERAIVIEATPKYVKDEDFFYAKISFRERDFAILKIEYEQRVVSGYDGIETKTAEGYEVKSRITFSSEFEADKYGIRLPSRHIIREAYFIPEMKKSFIRSVTTVNYDKYEFSLM